MTQESRRKEEKMKAIKIILQFEMGRWDGSRGSHGCHGCNSG